jgi:hypothetical protein
LPIKAKTRLCEVVYQYVREAGTGSVEKKTLKRMMGLEPTTFCMASRRSSQLSYIRESEGV